MLHPCKHVFLILHQSVIVGTRLQTTTQDGDSTEPKMQIIRPRGNSVRTTVLVRNLDGERGRYKMYLLDYTEIFLDLYPEAGDFLLGLTSDLSILSL